MNNHFEYYDLSALIIDNQIGLKSTWLNVVYKKPILNTNILEIKN